MSKGNITSNTWTALQHSMKIKAFV